jgi:hypothetical protein
MSNQMNIFNAVRFSFVFAAFLIFSGFGSIQAQNIDAGILGNDWENPEIVGINKESGHCTLIP